MNFKDDVFCGKQYKISNQIFKRKNNSTYQTTLEKIMLYCIFYTSDYHDKEKNIVIRYKDLQALLEKVIKDKYSEEYNNCLMELIDYNNECQIITKFNVEKFFLITDFVMKKVNIKLVEDGILASFHKLK